jgi:hypothetical protein
MAMVQEVVNKGVKKLTSLLVNFAATVGKELMDAIDAAEGRVLVLRSWDEETAAEFAFASAGKSGGNAMVAAAAREEREETKRMSVLLWRAHGLEEENSWCVFPERPAPESARMPATRGSKVVVRPGLEVVIPHHDVVKKLVGDKMFVRGARRGCRRKRREHRRRVCRLEWN